jgi:tetratricopeptide (TPR) repeat protein
VKTPSFKKLLSYLILFSFACGPGPLDYTEYFTIFYPEAANNPVATQPYFYTNDFLSQQYFMNSSQYLADSLNLESWIKYTDGKISKEELKAGLYEKATGETLAKKLTKIGKKDAAEYVLLAQELDKEVMKFGTYWEPAEPVQEQLLGDIREGILVKLPSAKDDFIKERYVFQLMKIDAKQNDWISSIKDYTEFQKGLKTKTYISEWSQSRYAGALLSKSDSATAIIEFAKVFAHSPTRRNQADLSVRRLNRPNFVDAISKCKSNEERVEVYALQAIQPYQDGLDLMKKIVAINPNHPILELIMAREINKNEVNFYVEKNAGLYSNNLDVFDDNYTFDSTKMGSIKAEGLSYFEELLDFNEDLIKNDKLNSKAYWFTTSAYLNYIKGDFSKMASQLSKANEQKPENPDLIRQIKLFETMHFLATNSIDAEEMDILKQISQFKKVASFRDNNVLVLLTDQLKNKYTENVKSEKTSSGWFQSCSKKSNDKKSINQNMIKAFLAEQIPAEKEGYFTYMNGRSEAGLLKEANSDLLEATLDYIHSSSLTEEDKKLTELAGLNVQELKMAYGRKLVRSQQYEKALDIFKQCEESHFQNSHFQYYFSPIPDQFVLGETMDEGLLSPLYFLEHAAKNQKEVKDNPKNARAWYELGLAAYNMSYWGNGWLFSDREWSIMEIEYGDPTDEDYFTNSYAKECFEKALAANPEPELGAKICYAGALCEQNQYHIAFTNGKPETYKQEDIDYYRIKMETSVKPTFQSFFKRLKNKYDQTAYESQVIKECMSYVDFKLQ